MIDLHKIPEFYRGYVKTLGEGELVPLLLRSGEEFFAYCEKLTETQGAYKYSTDKWTLKEVILHVIDTERVFAYRAMCFARNDTTELAGFDQNAYVSESKANHRTVYNLLSEFANVRATSVDLFSSFDNEFKQRTGYASGVEICVEAIGFIISGHLTHHLNIIKERYIE